MRVMKKIAWLIISVIMVFSLVMVSCGTDEDTGGKVTEEDTGQKVTVGGEETKEEVKEEEVSSSTGPKYGGTLRLAQTADSTNFDDVVTRGFVQGVTFLLTNESMWRGDWAKGPAGGYGTGESDWVGSYDVFSQKRGFAAESWEWSIDPATDTGILVYQIRDNIHFALNPDSEASKLVGGRKMTADDVVFTFTQVMTDSRAYMYRAYPSMRKSFKCEKTGPMEVTITVASSDLITAIAKFGNYVGVVPPEVVDKYGDMASWKNSVGTGPFMLIDYVAGSRMLLEKNPDYWGTDPVGPGMGNQVPYIDSLQYLIIPDASTRLAALRTGKIDQFSPISYEDAENLRKTAPEMLEAEGQLGGTPWIIYMNTQRSPFDNLKVRRALLMGVDLELIKNTLNHGLGQILYWPIEYTPSYADCYLGLDDPDCPESVKELYVYNPTKAKQLLAEAGYPSGFKTSVLIAQSQVDYLSVIKDMWSKIGVELELDVRESAAVTSVYRSGEYDMVSAAGGRGPISVFYHMVTMVGDGPVGGNASNIKDQKLIDASTEMQATYLTDDKAAMAQFRELMKYALDQAYAVSGPVYPQSTFWWPWLKNYSGEIQIGYFDMQYWASYIWVDKDLKKSMGY
jgi:peptide/nickel transport system substrate-binding protein